MNKLEQLQALIEEAQRELRAMAEMAWWEWGAENTSKTQEDFEEWYLRKLAQATVGAQA